MGYVDPRTQVAEAWKEIDRLGKENESLRTIVNELRTMEAVKKLEAENERLQEAKRRALLIADERSKENAALRAALALAQTFMPTVRREMPHQDSLIAAHKVVAAALEQGAPQR